MSVMRVLLVLSSCLSVTWSQQKPCQMYFTLQPPVDIPCNPYMFKNTSLSFQCMVSAPALNAYLQEVNFTIQWMKISNTPGALEEIIYPDNGRFEVITRRSSHMHNGSGLVTSVFVKSALSLDMNQASHMEFPGKYWCRVLAKSLENYSYSSAGDSGTTVLKRKSHYYLNNYPPCEGKSSLHRAELECVENGLSPLGATRAPPPIIVGTCQVIGDYLVSKGDLAIAIAGAIFIVILLFLSLMELHSYLNIKRYANKGLQNIFRRQTCSDSHGNLQSQYSV